MRNDFYQDKVWTNASGVTKLLNEMTIEHLWDTKEMLRIKADWFWGKVRGEVLARVHDLQSEYLEVDLLVRVEPVKRPLNWPMTTPLYTAICEELSRRPTLINPGRPVSPPPYSLPAAPIGKRIGQRIADTDEAFEQELEEWAEERMVADKDDGYIGGGTWA